MVEKLLLFLLKQGKVRRSHLNILVTQDPGLTYGSHFRGPRSHFSSMCPTPGLCFVLPQEWIRKKSFGSKLKKLPSIKTILKVINTVHYKQWRIQRFFENTVFSRGFQGRSPKGHTREPWRIIFSYKHAWMAWVIYYGKCIRHCVRGEFIQNYFNIFSFLLIWDKNLGSHPVD